MRTRRGRNEGSIDRVMRIRADGTCYPVWRGRVSLGLGKDGRYARRAVYGSSKADVIAGIQMLHAKVLGGSLPSVDRQTVADFLTRWLEDSVRPSQRPATYKLYEMFVRVHISPRIGGVRLQRLGPQHIEQMLSGMERDKASGRHRQIARAVLHKALSQAVKWRIIPNNPCSAVDKPRAYRKEMLVFDEVQAKKLLEFTKRDWLHSLYAVALGTGMRQGELLALRWADVDLDGRRLSVQGSLGRDAEGELGVRETKTGAGRRQIDLPKFVVDALREQNVRLITERLRECQWIFPDKKGNPISKDALLRRFKATLLDAKLPAIRFHDLRHTAATLMLCQGVHPKIVQERLGHSSITITLDIYSHVLPSMQRQASDRMDSVFG